MNGYESEEEGDYFKKNWIILEQVYFIKRMDLGSLIELNDFEKIFGMFDISLNQVKMSIDFFRINQKTLLGEKLQFKKITQKNSKKKQEAKKEIENYQSILNNLFIKDNTLYFKLHLFVMKMIHDPQLILR